MNGSLSNFTKQLFKKVKDFFDTRRLKHITFAGEDLFLPEREDDPLKRFKQIIFIQSSYLTIIFLITIGVYEWFLGLKIAALVNLAVVFINLLIMFHLKIGGKIYVISSIHIFLLWMSITFLILQTTGINSNMLVWYVLVITMAFEYLDDRFSIVVWLLIIFLSIFGIYFMSKYGYLLSEEKLPSNYELYLVVIFILFFTALLFVYISEKNLYQRQLLIKKADLETKTHELMLTLDELQKQNERIRFLNDKLEDKQMLVEHQISVLKTLMKSRDHALKQLSQKNKIINQYLHDIDDSLKYAEILQKMFLTDEQILKDYFTSFFIIHEQKQHVGGDFYYIKPIKQNQIFVALGDATGHGPAGAILSTIALQYLIDVFSKEIYTPARVLSILRKKIITQLSNFASKHSLHFGIEIAAILYDKNQKTILFAGLGRPIIILKKDILLEFISSNHSIIAQEQNEPVKEIKIKLDTHDKIFLFSDGYYSQLNPEFKKFSKKSFKKLLERIALQPLFTQKQIIEYTLHDWQENAEMTDDITIIGLQV